MSTVYDSGKESVASDTPADLNIPDNYVAHTLRCAPLSYSRRAVF